MCLQNAAFGDRSLKRVKLFEVGWAKKKDANFLGSKK